MRGAQSTVGHFQNQQSMFCALTLRGEALIFIFNWPIFLVMLFNVMLLKFSATRHLLQCIKQNEMFVFSKPTDSPMFSKGSLLAVNKNVTTKRISFLVRMGKYAGYILNVVSSINRPVVFIDLLLAAVV